jgi:hypothetical protein
MMRNQCSSEAVLILLLLKDICPVCLVVDGNLNNLNIWLTGFQPSQITFSTFSFTPYKDGTVPAFKFLFASV